MFYVMESVRFYFDHFINPDLFSHVTGSTLCVIQEKKGDEWVDVEKGSAFCHPNDQFSRVKGRKIALAKALHNYTKDRSKRKLFWDALFAKARRE